jgi:hypothetical protein
MAAHEFRHGLMISCFGGLRMLLRLSVNPELARVRDVIARGIAVAPDCGKCSSEGHDSGGRNKRARIGFEEVFACRQRRLFRKTEY